MTVEGSVRIYLRLDGDIAKQFIDVKKRLGLKNDSEVLRCLIADAWNFRSLSFMLDDFLEKLRDKVEKLEQNLKLLENEVRQK